MPRPGIAFSDLTLRSAAALIANFHAADALMQRGAREVVANHAERVVALARIYCPVDTGWMREHLTYRLSASGLVSEQGWWADDFIPFGKPFYPPFQELGTMRAAAQPSLYPAVMQNEPILLDELRALRDDAVRRLGRAA